MAELTTARPRFDSIDMVRGAALIAMVIYHCFWDLSYLRFFPVDVSADPAWKLAARLILAIFLVLVGFGLTLAHGKLTRWPSFWRRFGPIAAGALAITVATVLLFPQTFVYFGILHAIALFSLLALPFLRAPIWLVAVIAFVIMGFGWTYSDPFFNVRQWSWLGFWTVAPPTNDLVPVFPWFGVVLAGSVLARLVLGSQLAVWLAAIKADTAPKRALAWPGRWSLVLYLAHQPVLLAVLFPLSLLIQPGAEAQNQSFMGSCRSTCEAAGTTTARCETYCQCGLTGVADNGLWDAINSGQPNADQKRALDVITQACSALIYPAPAQVIEPPR